MAVQLAFYFDQTRCGACNACTVACKDWHQVNPGPVAWRKQFTYEIVEEGKIKGFYPFAMGCNHCDAPACAASCPVGAIEKDDQGIVTVDRNKCEGYKSCVSACPFAQPQIAGDKQEPSPLLSWKIQHPVQKCTMCVDRQEKGLKPVCVMSCMGRALDIGPVEYIKSKYPDAVRLNPADFPYAYINNKEDTQPNLFIKKLPDASINTDNPAGGLKIHKSSVYNRSGKY